MQKPLTEKVMQELNSRVDEYLRRRTPDLVLVSPLVEAASDQVDVVRAAQACRDARRHPGGELGQPHQQGQSSGPVARSHRRLERQSRKTRRSGSTESPPSGGRHRCASATTIGSSGGRRQPRRVLPYRRGLIARRPFILYTGSAPCSSRDDEVELPFGRSGSRAKRERGPSLREIGVLVRPHPYNGRRGAKRLRRPGDVAVWPRAAQPGRRAQPDRLLRLPVHCDAVVGINTSAMIEAGVVGRPVLAMADAELAGSQEQTVHFGTCFLRAVGSFTPRPASQSMRGSLRSRPAEPGAGPCRGRSICCLLRQASRDRQARAADSGRGDRSVRRRSSPHRCAGGSPPRC